jgi:hypothetical protein
MARSYYTPGLLYKFVDLHPEHQGEVLSHLDEATALRSEWFYREDFPTYEATWIAKQAADVNLERVAAVVRAIESGGAMRPILIAACPEAGEEESSYWVEGAHRAYAAEELGWKEIPALERVA